MDRQAVIERLEDLRDHCQSMIDKDDPASIWWGDTEALTEAIKALSLDINKNQKGDMNMTSEVKVTIEHEDGHKQELNGDTIICFTVSKAGEFLDGKAQIIDAQAAFIGRAIPDPIYSHTIGSLVASMVEKSSSGKVRAGFNLHAIAQVLEAKSKEIKSSLTEPEKDKAAEDAFKKFLEAVLSNR